jgi:hypothetical protein
MNCFRFFTRKRKIIKTMKKNFIAGVIVSLAVAGLFGGVSFAETAAGAKPAVTTEAKVEAPKAAKKAVKKSVKKKSAKKVAAKKVEAKKEVTPAPAK